MIIAIGIAIGIGIGIAIAFAIGIENETTDATRIPDLPGRGSLIRLNCSISPQCDPTDSCVADSRYRRPDPDSDGDSDPDSDIDSDINEFMDILVTESVTDKLHPVGISAEQGC